MLANGDDDDVDEGYLEWTFSYFLFSRNSSRIRRYTLYLVVHPQVFGEVKMEVFVIGGDGRVTAALPNAETKVGPLVRILRLPHNEVGNTTRLSANHKIHAFYSCPFGPAGARSWARYPSCSPYP